MTNNEKLLKGIGVLEVINTIQTKFRKPDGSIHATFEQWTEFFIPYTEKPK